MTPPPPSPERCCSLRFDVRDGITCLRSASAGAPLRVVRADPGAVCEAVVVQARGGLCAGDRWSLLVDVGRDAQVMLRGAGAMVFQSGVSGCRTRLRVGIGARLTWRSPGVIVRAGARAVVVTVLEVAPGAGAALSEVADCPIDAGLRSRTVVRRGGDVVHEEWTELGRGAGPTRLGPATHLGTALVVGTAVGSLRLTGSAGNRTTAWGRARPGVAVARSLGHSLQEIDAVLGAAVETVHRRPGTADRHQESPHPARVDSRSQWPRAHGGGGG